MHMNAKSKHFKQTHWWRVRVKNFKKILKANVQYLEWSFGMSISYLKPLKINIFAFSFTNDKHLFYTKSCCACKVEAML